MNLPVASPSFGNPFMEPLRTLESPGVRLWDRPFSSAAVSLSRTSSPPDLLPPHLSVERLEADTAVVTTSMEGESVERVASQLSSSTSANSTSSLASSDSSTQSVAYCGTDVETVSVKAGNQSTDLSRVAHDSFGIGY